MQVASNYLWTYASLRGDEGLRGGGALSRLYDTDHIAVAAMGQNSCFTRVVVPTWMRRWCAGPPVRAYKVCGKLPEWIRSEASPGGSV